MSQLSFAELQEFIMDTANKYAAIIVVYLKKTEQELPANLTRVAMELVEAYEARATNAEIWTAYHELVEIAKLEGIDIDQIAIDMMYNYIGLQDG